MFKTFLIPPPVIHPAPYVDGFYIEEFDILMAAVSYYVYYIHFNTQFYWLKTALYDIFLS